MYACILYTSHGVAGLTLRVYYFAHLVEKYSFPLLPKSIICYTYLHIYINKTRHGSPESTECTALSNAPEILITFRN